MKNKIKLIIKIISIFVFVLFVIIPVILIASPTAADFALDCLDLVQTKKAEKKVINYAKQVYSENAVIKQSSYNFKSNACDVLIEADEKYINITYKDGLIIDDLANERINNEFSDELYNLSQEYKFVIYDDYCARSSIKAKREYNSDYKNNKYLVDIVVDEVENSNNSLTYDQAKEMPAKIMTKMIDNINPNFEIKTVYFNFKYKDKVFVIDADESVSKSYESLLENTLDEERIEEDS